MHPFQKVSGLTYRLIRCLLVCTFRNQKLPSLRFPLSVPNFCSINISGRSSFRFYQAARKYRPRNPLQQSTYFNLILQQRTAIPLYRDFGCNSPRNYLNHCYDTPLQHLQLLIYHKSQFINSYLLSSFESHSFSLFSPSLSLISFSSVSVRHLRRNGQNLCNKAYPGLLTTRRQELHCC